MSNIDVEEFIKTIPGDNWLEHIPFLLKSTEDVQFSDKDIKILASKFENSMEKSDIEKIKNWLALGIIANQDSFFPIIRKKGLLRSSKYDFHTENISASIPIILNSKLSLSKENTNYLNSILALAMVGTTISKQLEKLLTQLKEKGDVLIRHIWAIIDYTFMLQVTTGYKANKTINSDDISYYNPEDLAEAGSYLYHLYYSKISFGAPNIKHPITTNTEQAEKALVVAAKIKVFQEYEVLVDALNYKITLESSSNTLTMSPPDENLERAIRVGYILSEMQFFSFHLRNKSEELVSIEKMGAKFHEVMGGKFITLIEEPIPRYVFAIPTNEKLSEILAHNSLYEEEVQAFQYAQKEWLIEHERMRDFEVTDGLTLWDISKAQRLFSFFRWYAVSHLDPIKETELETVLNSLVASLRKDDVTKLLELAVGDKAYKVIEFLSWDPNSNKVFDIQYQPLIKTGDHYSIPYNLMANSNLLRNSLQLSKKRFFEDGSEDPSVDLLEKSLKDRTDLVAKNVSFNWKGIAGEVDVIAIIEDTLFIFECKNSLLPCNIYEIRTSYDYVVKAGDQLDRFSRLAKEPKFFEYFLKKLGWPMIPPLKLTTCIVMANRMFAGYRHNNHPVRGNHEVINQITTGIIAIGDKRYCTWKNVEFAAEDLRCYLEDDLTYEPIWKATVAHKQTYDFDEFTINLMSISLDMETMADDITFRKVTM